VNFAAAPASSLFTFYLSPKKRGFPDGEPSFFMPDRELFGSSFGCNLSGLGALAASGRIAILLALAAACVLLGGSLDNGTFGLGLGRLRVGVTAAAYHGGSSQHHSKRKKLFHNFKRLSSVVLQRCKVR
jgi:hypothetical protein